MAILKDLAAKRKLATSRYFGSPNEFMAIAHILCMALDPITPREDAILAALRSISRVMGKETEFEDFVSYVNYAGKGQVPSSQDIVSHTPTWVQLTLPVLAKLYDTAFYHGQEPMYDSLQDMVKKDKD